MHPRASTSRTRRVIVALALVAALTGCDAGPLESCFEPTLSASLCDPASASFSLASTNPYYPLTPGHRTVLEGEDAEDGVFVRIEREVLARTEVVMGVETHVLEHREYEDGELVEIADNFYVEATDGTVCYFGEDVENYRNGTLRNMNGSWRAGVGDALPGIIMPAAPMVGQQYFQEQAPGAALDMGRVASLTETFTYGSQTYTDVIQVMDSDPIERCDEEEPKLYVAGIGEAQDVDAILVDYRPAP